ncbi:cell division protein FtsK [Kribbella sp. NPDC051770]|uniref:cell division protein FtsK n=1 Tax=Kribbella sp. NPDC051770 TaxID=3155413 RepID=UPI00342A9253
MPHVPFLLSRRAALRTVAAVAGASVLATGCDDDKPATGTPDASKGPDGAVQPPAPSTDPAVVAALTVAATQVEQLALRVSAAGQALPALRAQLAPAVQSHAAHVAKLKELGDFDPPQPGKLPALPKTTTAVLADLAAREQRLSVAHATAAGKLSGEAARAMAMIAASESQLAAVLTPKKKASA